MLTIKDIKRLIEAEKEVFATKVDFKELHEGFNSLQTSVDKYSKTAEDNKLEIKVLNHRVSELENKKDSH